MANGIPSVYLDTNIFQPKVYNSDSLAEQQFAQEVLESLRGDISNGEIDVIIPKPAIGELVNNYYEDLAEYGEAEVGSWSEFTSGLETYLDQVDATLWGVNQEAVSLGQEIIERDSRMRGTDAIIAGCALEDRWSNHLVTGDPDFHETEAIQAIDEERQPTPRFQSLNITDSY